jgi:hypothetical protein
MGIQDDVIQKIMANAEKLMPMQEEQMRFGIDTSRTAYDQSQADRDYMLSRRGMLSGQQDKIVAQANAFNEGDRAGQLNEEAQQQVTSAFAQHRGQMDRALAARGIPYNSGAALAAMANSGTQEAVARAGTSYKVLEASRLEGYQLTDRANSALAGYPTMGMQSTSAGAGFGAMGLSSANAGLQGMNSGFGSAGTMAGQMGQNATSMYGAQASYKNQQDQLNKGDSFGDILGGIGGLATGGAKMWSMFK